MTHHITRRGFLATSGTLAGVGLAGLSGWELSAAEMATGAPNAEKLGWRLGCQAYSFNRFSFFEAIDKTAALGLRYIEAYPSQKLSQDQPDLQIGESLSVQARKTVKQKLADSDVKLVCFGVVGAKAFSSDDQIRRVFEFAKDMGVETIVAEPAKESVEMIDKLCAEYQINLAIHNHPRPSHYWNPDSVLEVCQGRSKRFGACADTGHWGRSGLNPIECLKKLEGRIISFHFKDLNQLGQRKAHDVPWGSGACDAKGMLTEIHRQGIKAVFSIEYEHNWENSLPEIAQCVAYFDKVAAELASKS